MRPMCRKIRPPPGDSEGVEVAHGESEGAHANGGGDGVDDDEEGKARAAAFFARGAGEARRMAAEAQRMKARLTRARAALGGEGEVASWYEEHEQLFVRGERVCVEENGEP